MLGRLFKQNNPSNGSHSHSGIPHNNLSSSNVPTQVSNTNLFEDSYTREILYGTQNSNQLKPHQVNNKYFRIIVSQDGGNLRSKQVLFDSSLDTSISPNNSGACSTQKPMLKNKHIISSKIHHNPSELNDYMFGCGLPTNETQSVTKIHVLPSLNNSIYGSYQSILITRLFSITDEIQENSRPCEVQDNLKTSDEKCIASKSSSLDGDTLWNPTPTLPIRETSIHNYAFAKGLSKVNQNISLHSTMSTHPSSTSAPIPSFLSQHPPAHSTSPHPIYPPTSASTNNINSRFSIGLIIPLESLNDINDVVCNNWDEICHYLILLQKFTIKKLILQLNNSLNSENQTPFITNKRIQFPTYILQNEVDIQSQTLKLIRLVHYTSNIPKLINSNSLMKRSILNHANKYNSILVKWVLEVLNWLEFKDGKSPFNNMNSLHSSNNNYETSNYFSSSQAYPNSQTGSEVHSLNNQPTKYSFLASLLALLILFRDLLCIKPYQNVTDSTVREVTRVVVMTYNPVVAKKLIFIINAILPDDDIVFSIESPSSVSEFDSHESRGVSPIMSEDTNEGDSRDNENESEEIEEDVELQEDDVVSQDSSKFISYNDLHGKSKLKPLHGMSFPSPRMQSMSMQTISTLPHTNPIPIRKNKEISDTLSFSENSWSRSTPSNKGWEIPYKSASTTTSTPDKSRIETNTKGIPIAKATISTSARDREMANSSLSKSASMTYLSSSLTSSVSSNYSLSKLGGSFIDKWKTSFGSFTSNSSNLSNLNSMNNMGSSMNGGSYFDNSEYIPLGLPPATFGSLTKRNSIQSLRSPSPAYENDEFAWCPPPAIHSASPGIYIKNPVTSNSSGSINGMLLTPNKLSRTQSMFDLYNMNGTGGQHGIVDEERNGGETENHPNHNIQIKRTKTLIIKPLINDNLVKNVREHNRSAIKRKCGEIMKVKFPPTTSSGTTLIVFPTVFTSENGDFEDIDDVESFVNDQATLTSKHDERQIFSKNTILKHRALKPNVAFSDEFRPEFNIQSCPINPRLETQVMNSMKNDLLFYQTNSQYEKIVTRTVFISLKAREIEVIEMATNNQVGEEDRYSQAISPMSASSFSPTHGEYFDQEIGTQLKNRYKTRIKKVYTPLKNSGDLEAIHRVQTILDEINQIVISQQQIEGKRYNSNSKSRVDTSNFSKQLSSLVLSLLK